MKPGDLVVPVSQLGTPMRTSLEPNNRRTWVTRYSVGVIISIGSPYKALNTYEPKWLLVAASGVIEWSNPSDWRLPARR